MSAQELPREEPTAEVPHLGADGEARRLGANGEAPAGAPRQLTVASISRDGTRMLLIDAEGNEFSVAVAAAPAAESGPRRSEKAPMSTPSLRPRDIQARIRAGESPEAVADAAGTTVEKIMPFAAPVVAEREHMTQRAQKGSVRRLATESTARTLGDAVARHLSDLAVDPAEVEWDAWRRHDGRWALVAGYTTTARSGLGEFTFDPPGNFVSLDNDDARWLVGDLVEPEAPAAPEVDAFTAARLRREAEQQAPLEQEPTELPLDLLQPTVAPVGRAPEPEPVVEAQVPTEAPAAEIPPAVPPAEPGIEAPKPKSKRRGRASVPSWDEIMFGGAEQSD
jgi:hypothetical protein